MKTLYTIVLLLFISNTGFSQDKGNNNTKQKDTTQSDTSQFKELAYRILQKVNVNKSNQMNKSSNHSYKIVSKPLYRPTRLGSSSPLYDTYKKNDNGAGTITTNPQKNGRSFIHETPTQYLDSLEKAHRDSIPPKKD